MNDHLFPELRQSSARVDYNVDRPQPAAPPVFRTDTVSIRDTVYIRDTIIISRCCPYRIGLKTNLLYDAAAVPNIGIELPLGRKWSLAANWMYSWWHSDRIHWYWRTYGGDVALRRWFGGREGRPLTGHHLGVYGQMVTYDFELGARGVLGSGVLAPETVIKVRKVVLMGGDDTYEDTEGWLTAGGPFHTGGTLSLMDGTWSGLTAGQRFEFSAEDHFIVNPENEFVLDENNSNSLNDLLNDESYLMIIPQDLTVSRSTSSMM